MVWYVHQGDLAVQYRLSQVGLAIAGYSALTVIGRLLLERQQHCAMQPFINSPAQKMRSGKSERRLI